MSAAILSDCGRYRYTLERDLGSLAGGGTVLWLMLNPSTADWSKDDATIRRCRSFSQSWGFGRLLVGNLYAWRSTDPAGLWSCPDPVGPHNDGHLLQLAGLASQLVCAWGTNARPERVAQVMRLLGNRPMFCLGTTKDGHPKHPVRLPSATQLVRFSPYYCPACGYPMETDDRYGCPNCHGEGLS